MKRFFLRCLGANGGLLFLVRIILLAPNLARPGPAAPPGAPTRPAHDMSGIGIRQVYIGVSLYVLLGGRSGDVSSMFWRL